MTTDEAVANAIEEAWEAARAAGMAGARFQKGRDSEQHRNVSYAFELSGLDAAPDVESLEEALEAMPGVRARIIFPSRTAYVTAPDTVGPSSLVDVMEEHGVSAMLTESSLRRRIFEPHRTEPRSTDRMTRMPWRMRRHLEEEAKAIDTARAAGFLKDFARHRLNDPDDGVDNDVLFTARNLISAWRFWLALALTIPVLVLSYAQPAQFDGWQWCALALSTPVVTWCAWPFHRALAGGVRRGLAALDGASALAVLVAYGWSAAMLIFSRAGQPGWHSQPSLFAFQHHSVVEGGLFLDVACVMTVVLLGGRLLTMRTRTSLLDEMDAIRPSPQEIVTVVRGKRSPTGPGLATIPLQEVNVGDDLIVEGESIIPVDGSIIGGSCHLEPGLIGGDVDSGNVAKVGTFVFAGTRVLDGKTKIRVERTGHRTRMSTIHRWVAEANYRQIHATMLSTKTAARLIPAVIAVASVDFVLWYLVSHNLNAAVATALALLAAMAPVALTLSPSLAIRHGIESAARAGILFRDGAVVRQLDAVDTAIINRLGTLTTNAVSVENVVAERGENPELVLRVAAALVLESDHPASTAIVKAARASRDRDHAGADLPHWIDVSRTAITEQGSFTGLIELPLPDGEGDTVTRQVEAMLWRPRSMKDLHGRLGAAVVSGGTPLVVRWQGVDRGVILLHDTVREDAATAIHAIENQGVETVMISRDAYPVSRSLADRIGIDQVLAGISPGEKLKAVRMARAQGAAVAMIGDASVVDVMKAADVGVLVGPSEAVDSSAAAQRVARRGVDIIVLPQRVMALAEMIHHARRMCRTIDGNMMISWVYTVVAGVAAISGLLNPMVATLLMIGSSLLIEQRSNSLRHFARLDG